MPSATRNTKANSGSDGSLPGKPNTTSKTTAATPSEAAKDSTTVAMSSSGATSGAQQQHEHEKHDEQRRAGRCSLRVARRGRRAGPARPRSGRRRARSGPPAARAARGSRRRGRRPRSSRGRASATRRAATPRAGALGRTGRTSATPATRRHGAARRPATRAGSRDDDVGRARSRPPGTPWRQQLLALHGLDRSRGTSCDCVRPVDEVQQPERSRRAAAAVAADPDRPRAGGDALADAPPRAVRLVGARVAEVRDARPERPAPDDGQQRGQQRQHATAARRGCPARRSARGPRCR